MGWKADAFHPIVVTVYLPRPKRSKDHAAWGVA